jgi:protein required for attachment to host cells
MTMRYILVADASRARLFHEGAKDDYRVVQEFAHEESRARARDLMADANGRKAAGPSVGGNHGGSAVSQGVGRPGVAPRTEPKEVEAEKFARELASAVEAKLHNHEDRLVLVAPPQFLGLLKSSLSAPIAKRVERTLDKDLTKLEERELGTRLRDTLAEA